MPDGSGRCLLRRMLPDAGRDRRLGWIRRRAPAAGLGAAAPAQGSGRAIRMRAALLSPLAPAAEAPSGALPPGMHVLERGWLSSNSVLFEEGDRLTVVDTGYVDRKSTRLNSSHSSISYAVFCLKKKKK